MEELEFVRGDTFAFKFKIVNKDKVVIPPEELESLFITCRRRPERESEIYFQKTITDINFEDNYYHVIINPEDTETLSYPQNCYYLDIEATTKNKFRKTKLYELRLTKETTSHGGENDGI